MNFITQSFYEMCNFCIKLLFTFHDIIELLLASFLFLFLALFKYFMRYLTEFHTSEKKNKIKEKRKKMKCVKVCSMWWIKEVNISSWNWLFITIIIANSWCYSIENACTFPFWIFESCSLCKKKSVKVCAKALVSISTN